MAIAEYERQYHRAKWQDDDGESSDGDTTIAASSSKASSSHGEGSEYEDDAHLDDMSSDDSNWAAMEDELGRPGTDPEGTRRSRYIGTLKHALFSTRIDAEGDVRFR